MRHVNPYDHTPLLTEFESYPEAREHFEWDLPDRYNIATDLVETHSDAESRTALIYDDGNEGRKRYTYHDIDVRANQVANLLVDAGLERGDRVAVCLPDIPATVYTHMAVFKAGAILVPLSPNFGPNDLEYRLTDSSAQYLVTITDVLDTLDRTFGTNGPTVLTMSPDDRADGVLPDRRPTYSESFETCDTTVEDPALMMYTSGTTGDPKGVLHGHRVMLGYYPGFETWNNLELDGNRIFWSNYEWAFTGSLIGHLYCALHYGGTYLSRAMEDKRDPDEIYAVLDEFEVNNTFVRPGELQAMMESETAFDELEHLDVIVTGGAPYGDALVEWIESTLDTIAVELYGQTEANMFVSSCPKWFPSRPDRIGKAVPGAEVGVINQYGEDVGSGNIGELALRRSHPVVFKQYWEKPEKLESAFIDDWMLTESMCLRDDDGYYTFVARKDDIIALGEYYVSPSDVESVLNNHPDVTKSGVVSRDVDGTTSIEAYVELSDGINEEQAIVERLSENLATELEAQEVPERIEVIEEIPTTERGKIKRSVLRAAGH